MNCMSVAINARNLNKWRNDKTMTHHLEVYAQCRLRRGNTETVAWIPSIFAKCGKYVRIKDVNGWRVISVGKYLNQDVLFPMSNEHRHHHSVKPTSNQPTAPSPSSAPVA